MAENVTIYFDSPTHGDIKKMIDSLKESDPRYTGRSRSEVARMLLIEKLKDELEKYGHKR